MLTYVCSKTVGIFSQTFFTEAIFKFKSSVAGDVGVFIVRFAAFEPAPFDLEDSASWVFLFFSSVSLASVSSNVKSSSVASSPYNRLLKESQTFK